MLEVMKFIFSSFWIWAGTVVLIATIGEAFSVVIYKVRKLYKD